MKTITRKCMYQCLKNGERFRLPLEIEHLTGPAPVYVRRGPAVAYEVVPPYIRVSMTSDEVVCPVGVSG